MTSIWKAVAAKAQCSQAVAKEIVEVYFGEASSQLSGGGKVSVNGFGTFKPVKQAARSGKSPATGKPYTTPERTVVKFRPAPALKAAVG